MTFFIFALLFVNLALTVLLLFVLKIALSMLSDLVTSCSPFSGVLAGLIIDLGLLPVDLCTPTLMSKIEEELQSKADAEYWSEEHVRDLYGFMSFFAHRNRCDAVYRRHAESLAPRYVELFDK